ncbi:MAG: hypothetical protein KDC13_08225, partial [Bacteroidetes bacterium]|nr:hypothetical protein [Bacteroidota bacterium]
MKTLRFSVLLILVFVASCQSNLQQHGELFSEVMLTEKGLFRGVQLGEERAKVLAAEQNTPAEEGEHFLIYSGKSGTTGDWSIRYGFEDNLVYDILFDAEFADTSEGLGLLRGFRSYFNDRYGLYIKEGGYLVWKGNPADNADAVIEMIDESEFTDFGQFT